MADVVQTFLEESIPELEDLQRLRLFSKAEIKIIVKKRYDFEYLLKRKQPNKADFLNYIQYEIDLSTLRKTRKKRMGLKQQTVSDFASNKKIHSLFERTLRRYSSDIKIWKQYIDYCKSQKSYKILNRIFARAIQFHPLQSYFWIESGNWEYEHNQNISAARALFQRGLRINKHSKELWIQYFLLELTFMQRMKERRSIVGMTEEENNSFFSGELLKLVYKNAISNFPTDIHFRLEFVKYLMNMEHLIDEVYEDIKKDFYPQPECLKILAHRELTKSNNDIMNVISFFEKVLEENDLDKLHIIDTYISFLNSYLHTSADPIKVELTKAHLSKLFPQSMEKGILSSFSFLIWINFLLQSDQKEEAKSVASKAITIYSKVPALWNTYFKLELEIKDQSVSCEDLVSSLLKKSKDIKFTDCKLKLLSYVLLNCENFETFLQFYKSLLANTKPPSNKFKQKILDLVFVTFGIEKSRLVSELTFQFPPVHQPYFLRCIEIEQSILNPSPSNIRKLYDLLTSKFGKYNFKNWISYLEYERSLGELERVNALFWKAKKTLKNPTPFVSKYNILLNSK